VQNVVRIQLFVVIYALQGKLQIFVMGQHTVVSIDGQRGVVVDHDISFIKVYRDLEECD
jgi:hypothetical protein